MNCYSQLQSMQDCINDNGGFSYNKLDLLKQNNEIYKIFDALNIESLLRYELISFINILENPNYIYHEYLRKIHLHESEFVRVFNGFGYVISLYLNNTDSYRVFPLFFKECVDYFKIDKYNNMSLEQIESLLNKYMDLKKYYNYDKKKELNEVICKIPELYTTYSKYDNKFENKLGTINCTDQEEFFVYSEYEAYKRELHSMYNFNISNPKDYVKWVSRQHGDGYGYDVLSYDIKKNREKLIEVKSGLSDHFQLTRIEYKTMESTKNKQYADYYIYRYTYDVNTNLITLKILKYDKKNNLLIDINNNDIYNLIPYFDFEDGIQKVKVDVLPEDNYKKLLQRG